MHESVYGVWGCVLFSRLLIEWYDFVSASYKEFNILLALRLTRCISLKASRSLRNNMADYSSLFSYLLYHDGSINIAKHSSLVFDWIRLFAKLL